MFKISNGKVGVIRILASMPIAALFFLWTRFRTIFSGRHPCGWVDTVVLVATLLVTHLLKLKIKFILPGGLLRAHILGCH